MKRVKTSVKYGVPVLLAFTVFLVFIISPLDQTEIHTASGAVSNSCMVIIDPGHGGEDGGAVSITGIKESTLNLAIAQKLDLILAFYGVRTVMTRTTENIEYSDSATTIRKKKVEDQNNRIDLINSIDNAVVISIHQNNYPSSGPFGAQALYASTEGSKAFAEYMQQLLVDAVNPENRRTAAKISSDILLMNSIACPAILVECGFLSNPEEEALLKTQAYQLKLAAVIAAGYLYNEDTLNVYLNGGVNES